MGKQILILLTIIAATGATAQTPAGNPRQAAADTATRFADTVFRRPSFLYQQVQPDIPADVQSILIRFNNAITANKQWFYDYKNANAGQPLPYNQRFGISPDEYRRLQSLGDNPTQLIPVDTQKVAVLHEAGYIRFKTAGDIHLLDYLQIDVKHALVVYGGDTIPPIGRTLTEPSSPYGQWQGYTWRLEKADAANSLLTSQVTARVVEINLGLTIPDKKIFLRVKYQDMVDGNTTANLELVGFVL